MVLQPDPFPCSLKTRHCAFCVSIAFRSSPPSPASTDLRNEAPSLFPFSSMVKNVLLPACPSTEEGEPSFLHPSIRKPSTDRSPCPAPIFLYLTRAIILFPTFVLLLLRKVELYFQQPLWQRPPAGSFLAAVFLPFLDPGFRLFLSATSLTPQPIFSRRQSPTKRFFASLRLLFQVFHFQNKKKASSILHRIEKPNLPTFGSS